MVFSVRPSVCHTFLTMFPSLYHHEMFRSYYQWQKWRPCKRSRSEVKGQSHTHLSGYWTVTQVWIHMWWWNDAYSLMLLRRGAYCFSRSSVKFQGQTALKIVEFDLDQGSTLTVVRLGIPSSFCCRTTWTYVYGCPLVKLRKLIKWIILDWSFISNSVNLTCSGLILAISIVFSVCSTEKKRVIYELHQTLPYRLIADLLHTASLEGILLMVNGDVMPTLTM